MTAPLDGGLRAAFPIASILEIAEDAGRAVLAVYERPGTVAVDHKADDSPLTDADRASHAIIVRRLAALTPTLPIVSEEDDGVGDATGDGPFWLVDPLDGTKEFVKRTGEFTVNIALVVRGEPVAGVVHAPVLGTTWWGDANGAFVRDAGGERAVTCSSKPASDALRLVASRDHAGPGVRALLERLPGCTTLSMGSSLKFCLIAEGRADLYYRDGPTMPWDTAAAHAVVRAAGGAVLAVDGEPLRYDSPRTLNPHFLALGDPAFAWHDLIQPASRP